MNFEHESGTHYEVLYEFLGKLIFASFRIMGSLFS